MRKRFLLCMVLFSVLLVCAGCGGKQPTILLAGEGAPAYTIIRADSSSETEAQAALLVRRYLKACGLDIGIATDWKDTPVTPYEIVVGTTTRAELENGAVPDPHSLGKQGYFIKVIGTRIYIGGGSDEAIQAAAEKFLADFFGYAGDPETASPVGTVAIPADYEYIEPQISDITSIRIDGRDLREFRIAWEEPIRDIIAARELPKQIQSYFYDTCGIWLEIDKENLLDTPAVMLRAGNEADGHMSVGVEDGNLVISLADNRLFERGWVQFTNEHFTNEKGDIVLDKEFRFDADLMRPVLYSEFGAVGDGVTDDFDAIIAAHSYANKLNLPVKADEGAVYYIPAAKKSAAIQTDTDWTGARFILDDRAINFDGHEAQRSAVFNVLPSLERVPLSLTSLKKGAANLGVSPGQALLVYVADDSKRHFIRAGANANAGNPQQEILLADAKGNIDPTTPVIWNYEKISTCYGIPVDEKPITIQGGEFHTLANEINADKYISVNRNINITRSNVTVKGVKHTIEQTKPYRAAYGGFFNISWCNNVLIQDCGIQCHEDMYFAGPEGQKVLIGSYELLGSYNCNVTYQGVVQNNLFDGNGKLISSGLMGTNYCRNISMIDCVVARFDAHCQVYNVTVRGCTMERINLIGFGTALVEDTTILDTYIFNLRSDYGSMFGGDVIIRNVTMNRENTDRFAIFNGAWINHNFGYPLYMPRTVTIDNLTIPASSYITPFVSNYDKYEDVTKETLKNGDKNNNMVIVPESIKVISNPSGTDFRPNGGGIPFPEIEE